MIFKSFQKQFLLLLCIAPMPLLAIAVEAREQIHIVGSSTVYPFATVVAEFVGRSPQYKTPLVEATGSGGGMKLFCAGLGVRTPDIVNVSRRIKKSEYDLCQRNGVQSIIEIQFGFDGIVLARSRTASVLKLTVRDIFLALARDIPVDDKSKRWIPNPHHTWRDVNSTLPNIPIRVLGPPPTSGTRDAFAELAMEGGCKTFAASAHLKKDIYFARCHALREDGAWVEAGENDNLIVQKLIKDRLSLGVFGYSFLKENKEQLDGAIVNGYEPSFKNIASGDYPVSRTLYFYVKKDHIEKIKGMKVYMKQFLAPRAIGVGGYLLERGLIPLSASELILAKKTIKEQIVLSL